MRALLLSLVVGAVALCGAGLFRGWFSVPAASRDAHADLGRLERARFQRETRRRLTDVQRQRDLLREVSGDAAAGRQVDEAVRVVRETATAAATASDEELAALRRRVVRSLEDAERQVAAGAGDAAAGPWTVRASIGP